MSDTILSPNIEETKQNLGAIAYGAAQVTGFALSIKKHHAIPLDPEPAWYSLFKLKLAIAQHDADEWLTVLSPAIFSQVPQSIIDYGNLFDAAMAEVSRIVEAMGTKATDDEKEALSQIFTVLMTDLNAQKRTIGRIQSELMQFYGSVGLTQNAFATAKKAADKESADSKAKRDALSREIETLRAEARAAGTKTMSSGIALGVSLFVLVAAVAFTVATAGAATPIVIGVVSLLGVGASVGGLVVFTKEQNEKLAEIQRKLSDLSSTDAMIIAIEQVSLAIDTLSQHADEAVEGLGTLLNVWATLSTKLESVISDVASADKQKLTRLLAMFTNKSKVSWEQLTNYALALQRAGETLKVIEQPVIQKAA